MVAVPVATPVTTPVPEPTVATDVLLLLHVPPEVASLNVLVEPPAHTLAVPDIGDIGLFLMIDTVFAEKLATARSGR
jgi:hypothetical protein